MPNPIEVQKSLSGMDYPASKQNLIARARENGASKDIIDKLETIPDREYDGPSGVQQELF